MFIEIGYIPNSSISFENYNAEPLENNFAYFERVTKILKEFLENDPDAKFAI